MPFCPKCRQEYDQGFTECADCLVPLGETAPAEGGDGDAQQAVVFCAADEQVLDFMVRAIAVHHIPLQTASQVPDLKLNGHFLIVPAAMGEKVARVLDQGVPQLIGEGEGKGRIYRFYRPGDDEEIRDPELLRQPLSQLAARGEEILDELIEIVTRGDQAARHRAAYVLSCLGEQGTLALIKLLKVAMEKEEEAMALSLIRVVRDELESMVGWEEFLDALKGSPVSKILALQALTALGNLSAIPHVLPLLSDPNPVVRDEADNTLCTLSDEDMGFDTEAGQEAREAVIRKWASWWSRVNPGRNHG